MHSQDCDHYSANDKHCDAGAEPESTRAKADSTVGRSVEGSDLCVVSQDEDFQLAIARLFSVDHRIWLCDDWRAVLEVAYHNESTIVVIDASLWRSGVIHTRIATQALPAEHRLSVIRVYPYQLEHEAIEHCLCDSVKAIVRRDQRC